MITHNAVKFPGFLMMPIHGLIGNAEFFGGLFHGKPVGAAEQNTALLVSDPLAVNGLMGCSHTMIR